MDAQEAATFMRAFGDPTRLRVVAALTQGPLRVGELARLLECPDQRMSRHLAYLHARRVVKARKALNSVVYHLAEPGHMLHRLVLAGVQDALGEVDEVRGDAQRLARARRQGRKSGARKA